ncbi:MAG: DUF58 domain-containing protein [Candidatus Sumerlaeaceae bacterium]
MKRRIPSGSLTTYVKRWGQKVLFPRKEVLRPTRRYRLTASGVATLLLIFVVGYGAISSGTNLVYYLFAFLIAAFLTHGIASPRNLDRLQVRRKLPRRLVAGSKAEIHVEIENRRRWWGAHALVIEDVAVRKDSRAVVGSCSCLHIPARGKSISSYSAVHSFFRRRGLVTFRHIVLRSRFPFGFIERSLEVPAPAELLILPPVYRLSDPLAALLALEGEMTAARCGVNGDLYGLREYIPGEPAKRIHWRTTARARKLMIAEFEHEQKRRIVLYLPTAVPTPREKLAEDFEHAVVVAASFGAHLLELGYDVGLFTDVAYVKPASGEQQRECLLRALALVEIGSQDTKLSRLPLSHDYDLLHIAYFDDDALVPSDMMTQKVDARSWRISNAQLVRTSGS